MADNAIDKLIEEMRAVKEAIVAAECGVADARAAVQAAEDKHRAALKRQVILERTMEKHIYEDMPIVQAKMQVHEESERNYRSSFNSGPFMMAANGSLVRGASLSAASIATTSASAAAGYPALSASRQATAAQIARWLAGRKFGSC